MIKYKKTRKRKEKKLPNQKGKREGERKNPSRENEDTQMRETGKLF
jgi:hypothetical protein